MNGRGRNSILPNNSIVLRRFDLDRAGGGSSRCRTGHRSLCAAPLGRPYHPVAVRPAYRAKQGVHDTPTVLSPRSATYMSASLPLQVDLGPRNGSLDQLLCGGCATGKPSRHLGLAVPYQGLPALELELSHAARSSLPRFNFLFCRLTSFPLCAPPPAFGGTDRPAAARLHLHRSRNCDSLPFITSYRRWLKNTSSAELPAASTLRAKSGLGSVQRAWAKVRACVREPTARDARSMRICCSFTWTECSGNPCSERPFRTRMTKWRIAGEYLQRRRGVCVAGRASPPRSLPGALNTKRTLPPTRFNLDDRHLMGVSCGLRAGSTSTVHGGSALSRCPPACDDGVRGRWALVTEDDRGEVWFRDSWGGDEERSPGEDVAGEQGPEMRFRSREQQSGSWQEEWMRAGPVAAGARGGADVATHRVSDAGLTRKYDMNEHELDAHPPQAGFSTSCTRLRPRAPLPLPRVPITRPVQKPCTTRPPSGPTPHTRTPRLRTRPVQRGHTRTVSTRPSLRTIQAHP